MMIVYMKLIRDKIPEIISRSGKKYEVEVMSNQDFQEALLNKLVEEAREAQTSKKGKLMIELADLLEVIDVIIKENNFSKEDVIELQNKRREDRGGFDMRYRLLWTE